MTFRSKSGLLLAVAWLLATSQQAARALAVPPPPQESNADDDMAVLDRQLIMQQLDSDAEALGNIVAGLVPPATLAARTRSIANGARDARESFRKRVPGGGSRPEVWSNQADFARRMDAFVVNSEAMAKAGATGNVSAVTELMIDALPCKSCHDDYRLKKAS